MDERYELKQTRSVSFCENLGKFPCAHVVQLVNALQSNSISSDNEIENQPATSFELTAAQPDPPWAEESSGFYSAL